MKFIAPLLCLRQLSGISICLLAMLLLSSCIQRQQIRQGNILTEEEVAELQLGMNKIQVQYVLGSPSIINPMQQDRWEYVYLVRDRRARVSIRRGYLLFEDDRLVEVNLDDYFAQDN